MTPEKFLQVLCTSTLQTLTWTGRDGRKYHAGLGRFRHRAPFPEILSEAGEPVDMLAPWWPHEYCTSELVSVVEQST